MLWLKFNESTLMPRQNISAKDSACREMTMILLLCSHNLSLSPSHARSLRGALALLSVFISRSSSDILLLYSYAMTMERNLLGQLQQQHQQQLQGMSI